jgi:hypothetical protein
MWDVVGIVAAVVVIVLLVQMLDLAEVLKGRIRGDAPRSDLEKRLADLERRLADVERRGS